MYAPLIGLTALIFLAVGCNRTGPSPLGAAGREMEQEHNSDQEANNSMRDVPDWIAEANSELAAERGALRLSFFGKKGLDNARLEELLGVLSKLDQLGDLEGLTVTQSPISDSSFAAWGKAASDGHLESLRTIGFGGTQVGDESTIRWAQAAQAGQLNSLETIQLFNTQVTDASLFEWARAAQDGKLKELGELWLNKTNVSDSSLVPWAEAAQAGNLTKLERLALSQTQVTDRSLAEWSKAADAGMLPNLVTFWLSDTGVKTIDVDGETVAIPTELLVIGKAQELFAWIRQQRK